MIPDNPVTADVEPSFSRLVRFDGGRHPRAKIGYVLLATEQTIQDDVYRLRPEGIGVHFTRAPIPDRITMETLAAQAGHLAAAAETLLPDGSLDVICYACTSGSVAIGEPRVIAELQKGAPAARATTLITSVVRALRRLEAKQITVVTPYIEEINEREAAFLADAGFDVLAISGLNMEKDSDMVRVAPEFIAECAMLCDRPDADAVFISCGALRALDVVGDLELQLNKPVVCSNQAMIWDTLRLAGINDRIPGFGQLLEHY